MCMWEVGGRETEEGGREGRREGEREREGEERDCGFLVMSSFPVLKIDLNDHKRSFAAKLL